MSSQNATASIYIWHQPIDVDFAEKLATDLRNSNIIVFLPETGSQKISFNTIGWRLSHSDCVIFLFSENTRKNEALRNDVRKILRKNNLGLIPAIIDAQGYKKIPILLKFIPTLNFHQNYTATLLALQTAIEQRNTDIYWARRNQVPIWLAPIHWGIEHFRGYLTMRPLTFCWRITVENLIVSLVTTGLILFFLEPVTRTNLQGLTAGSILWSIIIVGPIIETLIFQVVPIFLARLVGIEFFGQVLLSMGLFAIPHFTRSIGAGIGAGLIGGFYSAFTYVHWRQKSLWTAFWVTALSHGLYNLAIFAMIVGEY
jgi:uncharacterized protein